MRPFFFMLARISLVAISLPILILLAYHSVLQNGFVWDDWEILNRAMENDGRGAAQTILGPVLPGAPYFRPMVMASFYAELAWGGINPSRTHFISFLLHALNTLILLAIALVIVKRLQCRPGSTSIFWASVGVCLYALHPALIESVAWASARFDLFATFFCLLYILTGLSLGGVGRFPLLLGLYCAALLSKEVAAGVPVLLACMKIHIESDTVGSGWRRYAPLLECGAILLIGLVGYFYMKSLFIDRAVFTDPYVALNWSGWNRIVLVGETIIQYAKIAFLPFFNIGPHHPLPWRYQEGFRPFVVLFGMLLLGGVSVWRIVLGKAWMLLGVLAIVAPISNILPVSVAGNLAQDRYLTFPLAAFLIWLIVGVSEKGFSLGERSETFLRIAAIGVVAIFILNVRVTVPLWKSDLTLWAWAAEKHIDEPYVRKNYAASLISYGFLDRAEVVLSRRSPGMAPTPQIELQEKLLRAQLEMKRAQWRLVIESLYGLQTHTEQFWKKIHAEGGDPTTMWLPSDSPVANSDEIQVFLLRSEAYCALGDYDRALIEAEKALFVNRGSSAARVLKALASYGLGNAASGNDQFAIAVRSMLPSQREGAERARRDLLDRLERRRGSASKQ